MRGQQILFKDLLESKKPVKKAVVIRGRSKELLENRDRCLAARYYYYIVLKKSHYESTMQTLKNEFYLSEEQITNRLMFQREFLNKMKTSNVTIRDFGKLFPWFNWNM